MDTLLHESIPLTTNVWWDEDYDADDQPSGNCNAVNGDTTVSVRCTLKNSIIVMNQLKLNHFQSLGWEFTTTST